MASPLSLQPTSHRRTRMLQCFEFYLRRPFHGTPDEWRGGRFPDGVPTLGPPHRIAVSLDHCRDILDPPLFYFISITFLFPVDYGASLLSGCSSVSVSIWKRSAFSLKWKETPHQKRNSGPRFKDPALTDLRRPRPFPSRKLLPLPPSFSSSAYGRRSKTHPPTLQVGPQRNPRPDVLGALQPCQGLPCSRTAAPSRPASESSSATASAAIIRCASDRAGTITPHARAPSPKTPSRYSNPI